MSGWHSCLALFSLNPISIKCFHVIYCLMRKEFNSNHLFWTTIHSNNWIRRSLYTICTNEVSECRIRNSYSFQLLAASNEYDRLYWLLWKLTILSLIIIRIMNACTVIRIVDMISTVAKWKKAPFLSANPRPRLNSFGNQHLLPFII